MAKRTTTTDGTVIEQAPKRSLLPGFGGAGGQGA
jgi:hypothetical protein